MAKKKPTKIRFKKIPLIDLEVDTSSFTTPPQVKAQLRAQAAGIVAEGIALSSFNHPGIRGIEREEPIRRFLKGHLPGRFHVGQGSIASSEVMLNRQHDIVVADRELCFMLLNTVSSQLMIAESVHLIIEVRSQANELPEVAKCLRAVRQLRILPGITKTPTGLIPGMTKRPVQTVIIYRGPKNPKTMINALQKANAPDSAPGTRLAIDYVLVLSSDANQNLETGYLIGYSRTGYDYHYYPEIGDVGLSGPKEIKTGGDSFAYWYAAILHHLSGVGTFSPVLHSYLGHQMEFVYEWNHSQPAMSKGAPKRTRSQKSGKTKT